MNGVLLQKPRWYNNPLYILKIPPNSYICKITLEVALKRIEKQAVSQYQKWRKTCASCILIYALKIETDKHEQQLPPWQATLLCLERTQSCSNHITQAQLEKRTYSKLVNHQIFTNIILSIFFPFLEFLSALNEHNIHVDWEPRLVNLMFPDSWLPFGWLLPGLSIFAGLSHATPNLPWSEEKSDTLQLTWWF